MAFCLCGIKHKLNLAIWNFAFCQKWLCWCVKWHLVTKASQCVRCKLMRWCNGNTLEWPVLLVLVVTVALLAFLSQLKYQLAMLECGLLSEMISCFVFGLQPTLVFLVQWGSVFNCLICHIVRVYSLIASRNSLHGLLMWACTNFAYAVHVTEIGTKCFLGYMAAMKPCLYTFIRHCHYEWPIYLLPWLSFDWVAHNRTN